MILSVKARRFISAAVDQLLDDYVRDVWRAFEREPDRGVSPKVADAALRALERAERSIALRLKSENLDENEEADLANDLYFIQAVQSDLKRVLQADAFADRSR
jgi:hypothetical protein